MLSEELGTVKFTINVMLNILKVRVTKSSVGMLLHCDIPICLILWDIICK